MGASHTLKGEKDKHTEMQAIILEEMAGNIHTGKKNDSDEKKCNWQNS